MTSLSLSPFSLFDRVLPFTWFRNQSLRRTATPAPDAVRERRDFTEEMLAKNPDAFTSDLDLQSVALVFPERF
ncbi:hypothetical protein [Tropicimonas isoalkanivorans]|uniref:Uncharacterized protein n=1 Tax=Tropicimonas isoalkanivorans TaxID=441112 RepID=A0A1I1MIH0_9RHOB|nr:hypothetical protein [Tropicimonas isoalkanivorans]SFC85191.1 hypothetical protein SAMN04488094_11046 [Tropicimonas isoalkanivorans]